MWLLQKTSEGELVDRDQNHSMEEGECDNTSDGEGDQQPELPQNPEVVDVKQVINRKMGEV